jgi:hypothetical protein
VYQKKKEKKERKKREEKKKRCIYEISKRPKCLHYGDLWLICILSDYCLSASEGGARGVVGASN